MTSWKPITEYYSDDKTKKAVINVDLKACYYFIDFYLNDKYTNTVSYPEKSIYYVQDAAENYTLGILNVQQTA
jgi:hypothetical protein